MYIPVGSITADSSLYFLISKYLKTWVLGSWSDGVFSETLIEDESVLSMFSILDEAVAQLVVLPTVYKIPGKASICVKYKMSVLESWMFMISCVSTPRAIQGILVRGE